MLLSSLYFFRFSPIFDLVERGRKNATEQFGGQNKTEIRKISFESTFLLVFFSFFGQSRNEINNQASALMCEKLLRCSLLFSFRVCSADEFRALLEETANFLNICFTTKADNLKVGFLDHISA